jgi:peptide/nickel transport system substrate-binding protein
MNETSLKGKKGSKKGKGKSKKHYSENVKKQIISSGIVSFIAIAGLISGIFLILQYPNSEEETFIMGYSGGLNAIDPLESGESLIITQVVEPLFTEILKQDSSYRENIPHLAKDWIWSSNGLNFTCILRENITFHDGTAFNASVVKWNFDRLHRLLFNMSTHAMWYHLDGTLIINRTIVLDEYIIRFVLNRPFVPFKALLTSLNANILSPSSTPEDRFIYSSEIIVGTGPYILESNIEGQKTTLLSNDNYWGLPKPSIDKFIFIPYDYAESSKRFLAKETNYAAGNDTYFSRYHNDPSIVIDDFISPNIDYLGMNNIWINTTMRKAISYALNYSLILETRDKYSHGTAIRCRSPLPYGTLYSNWQDFDIPSYNIQIARQTLVDVNWTGTSGLPVDDNISSGNKWEVVGNSPTPLATYNITYINGSSPHHLFLKDFSVIIANLLKQIGVRVLIFPMTKVQHWSNIILYKNTTLFWVGATTLINDPAHLLDYFFSNKSGFAYNLQQTEDLVIQSWMEDAIIETNPVIRNQTYFNIQKRIIEEIFPVSWLYSDVYYDVYRSNLKGWGNWGAGSFKYLYFA